MTHEIIKCNRCQGNGDISVSCPPWGYWYEKCPTFAGWARLIVVNGKLRPYFGRLLYRAANGQYAVLPQVTP